MNRVRILVLALALGGCVSAFPEDVLRTVDRSVTVSGLRRDPEASIGRRVMIGGDILTTRPMPGATEIELLSKPLEHDGRPQRGDVSDGRVIVKTVDFLDPAVYAERRQLTVVGIVTGQEERKIGDLPYRYPVVTVVDLRLWPRETPVPPYPPPWPYYYSWPYGPYRAWGAWPYWW